VARRPEPGSERGALTVAGVKTPARSGSWSRASARHFQYLKIRNIRLIHPEPVMRARNIRPYSRQMAVVLLLDAILYFV
jgi:hypothetical protein